MIGSAEATGRRTEALWFDSQYRQRIFSLQTVQTDCEIHAVSSSMGTTRSFPGNKPAEAWSVMVKFTLEQAMKAQRGSRGTAQLFL